MKLIIIGIILAFTSIVNGATSPYVPEVEDRFVSIESVNSTQTTNVSTNTSDIATINSSNIIKSVKATYDFSVDGGAVSEIDSGVTIPDNALVIDCYIDIITAMVSTGNNGTIAVHLQSANDILSAVDADTLSGIEACVPTGTAASAFKLTAARELKFTIGTNAITAGKFVVVIEYVVAE